jgi:hypothetical protein
VGAPIAVRRLRKPALVCTREGLVGCFIAWGNTGEWQCPRAKEYPAFNSRYGERHRSARTHRGGPRRTDGYRGVRPAGEGEGSTWRRGTSRGTQRSDRGSRACSVRAYGAAGRARRAGRRDVAARRHPFQLALFERKILQKFE